MNTSRGARLDARQAKRTLVSNEDTAETDQNAGRWPRHRERKKTALHVTHTPKVGIRKVDIIGNKSTKAPPNLQEKASPMMKDAPVIADLSEIFYFSEFLNS